MTLSDDITVDQLRIRIHHVGGRGGYGPTEVLNNLGHVQWVVYDADEDALDSSQMPEGEHYLLMHRCISGSNSRVKFHVTSSPTASSMLRPAEAAANYTLMLPNGSARVWGTHTRVTKVIDIQAHTLDWLIDNNEVPPIDFLSIDAQGAELAILEGAAHEIGRGQVVGVICETEFAELYAGQPLFCDLQKFLQAYGLRFCEIYNQQYMNTGLYPQVVQGRGFLTVGESLFLRQSKIWDRDEVETASPVRVDTVVRTLKLAAIAVAFDQVDYAVGLCRDLEMAGWLNLSELAARLTTEGSVKYINMLNDLCAEVSRLELVLGTPPLEQISETAANRTSNRIKVVKALGAIRFVSGSILGLLRRRFLGGRGPVSGSQMGELLRKYGLNEVAVNQSMRLPKTRQLSTMYMRALRRLFA